MKVEWFWCFLRIEMNKIEKLFLWNYLSSIFCKFRLEKYHETLWKLNLKDFLLKNYQKICQCLNKNLFFWKICLINLRFLSIFFEFVMSTLGFEKY